MTSDHLLDSQGKGSAEIHLRLAVRHVPSGRAIVLV